MFSEFIKLLKLPLRLVAFIAILTGILFFLPTKLREYFLLTDFYSSYGKYVGLLFFISFAYFFLLLSEKVFRVIKRKRIQVHSAWIEYCLLQKASWNYTGRACGNIGNKPFTHKCCRSAEYYPQRIT